MPGPMKMRGKGMPRGEVKKGTMKRLIRYLFKYYKVSIIFVFVCLIVSAAGGLVSSVFTQKNISVMTDGVREYSRLVSEGMAESTARKAALDSVWGALMKIIATKGIM